MIKTAIVLFCDHPECKATHQALARVCGGDVCGPIEGAEDWLLVPGTTFTAPDGLVPGPQART